MYRVTSSRQTNIRGFGFGFGYRHSTTGLLISASARNIYLLSAGCPCDVTTFVDLTSFVLLNGSSRVGSPGQKPQGRVGSRVKNPDPVPSLICTSTLVRRSIMSVCTHLHLQIATPQITNSMTTIITPTATETAMMIMSVVGPRP